MSTRSWSSARTARCCNGFVMEHTKEGATMPHDEASAYRGMGRKHLDRHVAEFAGRHNMHEADTIDMMEALAKRAVGKRLRYRELIA